MINYMYCNDPSENRSNLSTRIFTYFISVFCSVLLAGNSELGGS